MNREALSWQVIRPPLLLAQVMHTTNAGVKTNLESLQTKSDWRASAPLPAGAVPERARRAQSLTPLVAARPRARPRWSDGVKVITQQIEARMAWRRSLPDPDLEARAAKLLTLTNPASVATIRVTARNGWLTLEGRVQHWYEREKAERALHDLEGARGVRNRLLLDHTACLSATGTE